MRGDLPADLAEQIRFQLSDALPRVQDDRLVLLELLSEVALAVDQRLLADVLRRRLLEVGVGNFDIIAEDVVEAIFSDLMPVFRARGFPARRGTGGRSSPPCGSCRAPQRSPV